MSIKQKAAQTVRSVLPSSSVRALEMLYRRGRIIAETAQSGYPARRLRVIAVTGTNGKTTTVNLINQILKSAGYTTAMFSTALIEVAGQKKLNDLNATVGTTAQMQKFFRDAVHAQVDYVVLEVTSHSLDQHKLDFVPIDIAVMTNLTQDHLDYHKTMQRYAEAKGKLFAKKPRVIILNQDDQWYSFFKQFKAREQQLSYGQHAADVNIDHLAITKQGSTFTLVCQDQKIAIKTALPGEYNAYNIAAAAGVALALDIPAETITEGVAALKGVPGRFERVAIDKPYDVIVDYAHTPDAIEKLLQAARAMTPKRVFIVFGATGDRDKGKRPIMGELAARLADKVFLTDDETYNEDPQAIRDQVRAGIEEAHATAKLVEDGDRRRAIKLAMQAAKAGDIVLVTGMGHEQFRIVNGKRLPWNDATVVRELAKETASSALNKA